MSLSLNSGPATLKLRDPGQVPWPVGAPVSFYAKVGEKMIVAS